MYLKSLELSGFKSFAKKSAFEFKTPITAIVGPNGSGKSNCAEAFRFVLGEQSMKSLRGKRSEDLIFNGSADVSRSNRAQVKLTLDNSRRILNVDFDEVAVERVVYRDSENEYYINGSRVRLKDVLEILAAAHIGASSHHIISQGEADKVLDASPKDRKAMVEDALGLRVYHYKKQESERKLKKTLENISSVDLQRKEIAPHLKFLGKQVEKIKQTEKLREELGVLYKEYLKREELYLTRRRRDLEAKRAPVNDRLESVKAELEGARNFLEQVQGGSELNRELTSIESELNTVRTRKDELAREIGRIEGEVASYERFVARERERAASSEHRVIEFGKAEHLSNTLREMIREAQSSGDPGHIRHLLGEMHRKIDEFVAEHGHAPNEVALEEAERELARLGEERAAKEAELESAKQDEQKLRERYEEIRARREDEQSEARKSERRVFELMSEQNNLHSELSALAVESESIKKEEDMFDAELRDAGSALGMEVTKYREFDLTGGDPSQVEAELVMAEPRERQSERKRRIEKIKIRLEDAGSYESQQETLREYRELSEHDAFLERELNDLRQAEQSLRGLIADLNSRLETEFGEGLKRINAQFQEYFGIIFGGGSAGVEVVRERKRRRESAEFAEREMPQGTPDEEDEEEVEEGLEIKVSLPRKKIRGLEMLSGGERALTSIALVFAISMVNPPPFIVLDETDAALDEANSRIYGDMIARLAECAQLIIITHNRETMSRAGALYGVSMGSDGISRLLSVKMDE